MGHDYLELTSPECEELIRPWSANCWMSMPLWRESVASPAKFNQWHSSASSSQTLWEGNSSDVRLRVLNPSHDLSLKGIMRRSWPNWTARSKNMHRSSAKRGQWIKCTHKNVIQFKNQQRDLWSSRRVVPCFYREAFLRICCSWIPLHLCWLVPKKDRNSLKKLAINLRKVLFQASTEVSTSLHVYMWYLTSATWS